MIGEASRNVERHHPEIPWPIMYTLRNQVAHYQGFGQPGRSPYTGFNSLGVEGGFGEMAAMELISILGEST